MNGAVIIPFTLPGLGGWLSHALQAEEERDSDQGRWGIELTGSASKIIAEGPLPPRNGRYVADLQSKREHQTSNLWQDKATTGHQPSITRSFRAWRSQLTAPVAPVMARDALYTAETIKLAYDVLSECLRATEDSQPSDIKARGAFKIRLVQAILRAVAAGERDPEMLKTVGLKSVGQHSDS